MQWARSWFVAAVAVCLLATPAAAQVAPEASTLRAIEGQVAQIRGLPPLAAPDLLTLDHITLHAYLVDEFERNYLPSEREADQKQMVALGLLQPTDDLVQIQLSLLSDQV